MIRSGVRFHFSPVQGSRKMTSLSRITPRLGSCRNEAPHLEAARVAEDRTLPVHEPVDPAGRLEHPRARPAEEVERIDDHALDADGAQVVARCAAHAGARGIGQERGHGERPASCFQRLSHSLAPGSG